MIKERKGQSLVDILIGLAIVSLGIGLATILVYGGQSILVDRGNATIARSLAREGLEGASLYIKNNWNGVADGNYGLSFTSGVWQLTGTADTKDIFTRQISVSSTASEEKIIKSIVRWEASPSRTLSVENDTLVTNWQGIEATGGDTGGGGLTGDWQNPRTLGSIDLGPGNSATDLDVISKIVYMSAEASAAAKPDFFIIDATNGQNPFIVSSLNTGPSLNSLDVSGDYAYVANKQSDAELQIIDISNRSSPTLVISYAVPGVTGSSRGKTVFYSDSKVYLGLNKVTGPEFHVIDVSNPASPTQLGSYEIEDNVNDIYVRAGKAYLATELGGAGLIILDVSNPSSISLLGQSYSVDTNSVYLENPAVLLLGPGQDLYTVDASNPSTIATLGTISVGDVVSDIVSRDYLAFIASSNSNREFQVINIATSTSPTLWSYFNFPQVATGIDYEDNLVYVSVRSNDALRIITSQ